MKYRRRVPSTFVDVCEDCGAVVGDRDAHDRWHAREIVADALLLSDRTHAGDGR